MKAINIMIKNKIILIPSITIIILLSLFITIVYGYKLNSNIQNETNFLKIFVFLLISLLIIFNFIIYVQKYEKPHNLIV
jgi:hypothetical protein